MSGSPFGTEALGDDRLALADGRDRVSSILRVASAGTMKMSEQPRSADAP
jgi:hypothetical protein